MAKFTKNIRKPWAYGNLCKLKKLAWKKTPTHLIAQKMERTVLQIRTKAFVLGCSLFN